MLPTDALSALAAPAPAPAGSTTVDSSKPGAQNGMFKTNGHMRALDANSISSQSAKVTEASS